MAKCALCDKDIDYHSVRICDECLFTADCCGLESLREDNKK